MVVGGVPLQVRAVNHSRRKCLHEWHVVKANDISRLKAPGSQNSVNDSGKPGNCKSFVAMLARMLKIAS